LANKMPELGTKEADYFCQQWDSANPPAKLELCNLMNIAYQTGKNFRVKCRYTDVKQDIELPDDASWEEHLQTFKAMDKLVAIHQKVPLEITVELKTDKPIGVVFDADWQLGMFGVDYDSFQADNELIIKEPGLYDYIGGDGYQNIIQASKVGSSHNQIPISPQKGFYYLTLEKRLEKIIAVGTGNHNYWTSLLEGEDWDRELCRRLKLVYTKHGGILNLKVGDFVYPILRLHKTRFESSFNLTHACRQNQRLYFPQARVIVCEHKHTAEVLQYRYADNECVGIRTGTYAVYDDFAQQNGFYGAHVSNPTVIFYPGRDHLIGFKDMRDAVVYLRAVR